MTRIGTYGARTAYINRMLDIETRTQTDSIQTTTGLKSEQYSGIAVDANALLNAQTEQTAAEQYVKGNTFVTTQLDGATQAVSSISSSIKTFKKQLDNFYSGNTTLQSNVEQIQKFAFQTMLDIGSYLGVNVGGSYLFSGGRVTQSPVQIPGATIEQFQSIYNGSTRTWPTTRAAQLLSVPVPRNETGKLIFNANSGTISAANADSLTPLATGAAISVANTVFNNTTFQIHSHAAMNVGGTALAETNGAGSGSPSISFGSTPTRILPAASGDLNFAFAADGNMTITPTTANSLASLTAGVKFTINGSTGNAWDGAYKVVGNVNGVVEIATDTDQAQSESITQSGSTAPLSLSRNYGAATSLTTGTVTLTATPSATAGKTTVTITSAGASDLSAYAAGNTITIGGSSDHNGTFTVTAATANTVSFDINSDALRVSQFLPQTGRNDVSVKFNQSTTNDLVSATSGSLAGGYGTLSFSPTGTTGERITASNGANSFLGSPGGSPYPPVGQVITLSSTSGVNDGVYKVTANGGSYIEVESVMPTTESVTTGDISTSSWYKGDTLQIQHRIDDNRQVDVGVYASDPAFEKIFRALGLIAQGAYGTAGGLDQNQNRIAQARWLINDALSSPADGTPPFGTELRGDIDNVAEDISYVQATIKNRNDSHNTFIEYLKNRVSDISTVDPVTAATLLNSDNNSLQASFQILSKVQSLNLLNYLS